MGRIGWLATLGVAICLGIRLVYFLQYAQALPFLWGPTGDSAIYVEQAAHVLAGEHGDATLLAFSPLYGYVLALLRDPVAAAVLQLLSGTVLCGILFATVYRFTDGDRTAAFVSALCFALYGGALFFESKVLSDSLGLFLVAGAQALFLLPRFRRGRIATVFSTGIVIGLAVLARASLIFSAPLFALAALFPFGSPSEPVRVRVQRSAVLTLGVALVLVGHGLWTKHHAGVFVPVILPAETLQASQSAKWSGDIHAISGGDHLAHPYGVVLSAREYLAKLDAGEEPPPRHVSIDLGAWFRGLPHKLPGTFSNTERTFQYGYLGERSAVPTLRVLPVSFGVLLILGMLGAWVLVRRKGPWALVPLLPLFLGAIACTTLYHPSSRYRLAMIIPLLILAGPGVSALWQERRERGRRLLLGAVLAACVAASAHSLSKRLANHALWELELATSTYAAGDDQATLAHLDAAEAADPDSPVVRQRVEAGRRLVASRQ